MQNLINYCEQHTSVRNYGGGEPTMSMYEMVHITVWYLANQSVMREISNTFGRTISSVWTAIDRVTSILEKHQEDFIKWPDIQAIPEIATEFANRSGFPGVVGVIDGTHIPIDPPRRHRNAYISRKFKYTLNNLAVVLPNRFFSYTLAGYPGW